MALYSTLPIFKISYDYVLRIFHLVNHLPREYRYSYGERLLNASMDLLIHIYKVNLADDKTPYLIQLNEKVQLVYILLRLAHDLKLLPTEKYASIVSMIDEISSQAKGWLKAQGKLNKNQDDTDFSDSVNNE